MISNVSSVIATVLKVIQTPYLYNISCAKESVCRWHKRASLKPSLDAKCKFFYIFSYSHIRFKKKHNVQNLLKNTFLKEPCLIVCVIFECALLFHMLYTTNRYLVMSQPFTTYLQQRRFHVRWFRFSSNQCYYQTEFLWVPVQHIAFCQWKRFEKGLVGIWRA